ncbi:MAG: inorganic phosphate transporter [Thermoleophilia bacterium]
MDSSFLLVLVVVAAIAFDMMNGFHDGCNAVSTVIYTKALKPHTAIFISAVFNFVGPFLGVQVAKTIGGVINFSDADSNLMARLVVAAMIGALLWDVLTWLWGLPVSSSHALVGGLLGAGVMALGLDGVNWAKLGEIMAALIFSPVIGMVVGLALMMLSKRILAALRLDIERADGFYKKMQIFSSSFVSFTHGSNDATKVMGIIALFLAAHYHYTEIYVPVWVILACAGAMALGTYLSVMSMRLVRTLGEGLTTLHPVHGFSAESGAAMVIFTASRLGLPVSTTHVVTSAVTGTGMASGFGSVGWRTFRDIILAWLITLPFCAGVAAASYYILSTFTG